MSKRDVVSDEVWAVNGPLFPGWKGNGRPVAESRLVVEGVAWKFRTGAPWRDVPERFGNWITVFKNFDRWARTAPGRRSPSTSSPWPTRRDLDWVASIDSTIVRVHQHGANLPRDTGGPSNYRNPGPEPADHAIGRSRGGLTTKLHLVSDGKGLPARRGSSRPGM